MRFIKVSTYASISFMIIVACLIVLGCNNADEADPDGGHGDTDSDTDTDTDSGSPLDMNCDGGYLFNYGMERAQIRVEGYYGLYTNAVYNFEYDANLRPIYAYVEILNEYEGLIATYERSYFYDENGRLERLEWTQIFEDGSPDQDVMRRYTYDNQGRTILEEYFREEEYDNTYLVTIQAWEYDENDRVVTRLFGSQNPKYEYDWGYAYEYDEEGKVLSSIKLDPYNGWAETKEHTEYNYHSDGRFLNSVRWSFDEYTGKLESTTYECTYYGNTARLQECFSDNGYSTTYAWDGGTLTSTDYFDGEPWQQLVITFTNAGSSLYWEVYPPSTSSWIMGEYGNGFMNGCAGQ